MIGPNGNLLLNHSFDPAQCAAFFGIAECQCDPFGTGSSGPSDAMHIVLRLNGQIEIDDMRDVVDIDAAGGNVRRDQDSRYPSRKPYKAR